MGLFGPNVGKMERNRDFAGLIAVLDHKDSDIENKAQMALVRIGELAVEPLIHALKDENRNIRWRAAETLGKIGDARAVEPFIQALMDGDFGVREHVVRALGRIRDARAMEPLAQALRDKTSSVRFEVAEALDELSWKPGNDVEKAHYLIAKGSWGELVMLGEPSIEPLIQALKDDDKYVREAAEAALEKIKSSTLAKTSMTKKLMHVLIFTAEPFEENEANIAGCVIAAFPEQLKKFDPATGRFALQEGEFGYSIVRPDTFKDRKTLDAFMSWMKNVKEGVHDLPQWGEVSKVISTPRWGQLYLSIFLEKLRPEFANSTAFIRKWSVIDGKFLVIGVYSMVPQEAPKTPPPPPPTARAKVETLEAAVPTEQETTIPVETEEVAGFAEGVGKVSVAKSSLDNAELYFSQRNYVSAIEEILKVLNEYPRNRSALDLAQNIVYLCMGDTAGQKIPQMIIQDPLLDPIFAECSQCRAFWPVNPLLKDMADIVVTHPVGGKCETCGKVFCRKCAITDGLFLRCPQCNRQLGIIRTPTGRTRIPRKPETGKRIVQVCIFKEAPEPANMRSYIQLVLETLVPEALVTKGVGIYAETTHGEANQFYVIARTMIVKPQLDLKKYDVITQNFTDKDGGRGMVLKVYEKEKV